MIKKLLVLLLVLVATRGAKAQYTGPLPGDMLPDMTLNIVYPEIRTVTNESLKGKPVILIFISKGCLGSFLLLPEANTLYEKFRDRVSMIMIPVDNYDNVMKAYHQYRKNYGLSFPVADDRIVHKRLGVKAVPHLLWVDASGTVEAISHSIREEELRKFSQGEPLNLPNPLTQRATNSKFDREKPLLVNNNGGEDTAFFQRSVFAMWKPGMPDLTLNVIPERGDPFAELTSLQVCGRRLKELYRIAYIGRSKAWHGNDSTAHGIYRYQPILEVADSAKFAENPLTGANLYCYSQTLPPAKRTRENMMRVMQADLKNCFGYDVTIETRRTPYWRLVAGKHAARLLEAKPGRPASDADDITGGKFYGTTVTMLVSVINHSNELIINDRPLMDETGIKGHIDIELNAVMTDLDDIRRALRAYDLDIVPGERDMKVIVIRDPMK
jgi:hypothetical protein